LLSFPSHVYKGVDSTTCRENNDNLNSGAEGKSIEAILHGTNSKDTTNKIMVKVLLQTLARSQTLAKPSAIGGDKRRSNGHEEKNSWLLDPVNPHWSIEFGDVTV
jgi:hypothetical protein